MVWSFRNTCQFSLAPLMQGLSILDASVTLNLPRLNVQKLNFMLPLWRRVRIPHSAVKMSMDIVNSKGTMLTLLKFRARWVYLEHPGVILLYTPRKGSLWKGLPLTLHTGQN